MAQDRRSTRWRGMGCAAWLLLGACGGITKFDDTTAIAVTGPVQEAPPSTPKRRVAVKNDHIEISEKIQFDLAKATIKPESDDLLAEIAKVFTDNPQIKKVEIIGHTSDEGAEKYNLTLSEQRAKAVRDRLIADGISGERLSFKGMGESQPVADNGTEAGRELNRRVEFMILEQDGAEPVAKSKKKKMRGAK